MSALTHDRPYLRSVGDEPLPGYRLVAPLGRGGFGEVWKCVAPGGLSKAVKFVLEADGTADEGCFRQEYEAFLRVKGIRHPFLLTLERVELIRDELIMVMELADESLEQRFGTCRAAGQAGIDRRHLLAYMVDIAEALDVLSGLHGLQHLDIKPANLFLMGGHVKVGDYGLVSRYRRGTDGRAPQLSRGLTPKYVAPEILSDRVDGRTDQYSLALVYFELLTGTFPYSGKSAQQLIIQHTSAEPDLRALPESDRAAVGKALRKSPAARFPTCLAFVKALLQDDPPVGGTAAVSAATTRRAVPPPAPAGRPPASDSPSVAGTQRLNPAVTRPSVASASAGREDLAVACPDLRYLGEAKSGPRGRLVRAADPTGAVKAVRLLRLEGGAAADLDELFQTLTAPLPGAVQDVIVPQPRLLAVVWDADTPTLRDWLAATDSPSRATTARLLEPLGPILDGLHAAAGFAHQLLTTASVVLDRGAVAGVTGFGFGEALRRSRADTDWLADHPYAAPESLAGRPGRHADQYALALIYLELRGVWSSDTPKDRAGTPRVKWDLLAKEERKALQRALATAPEERFPSCAAFLDAVRPSAAAGVSLESVRLIESTAVLLGAPAAPAGPPEPPEFAAAVVRLAQGAAGLVPVPTTAANTSAVVRQADGHYTLRFPVKLSAQLTTLRLSAYMAQHGYQSVPTGDGSVRLKSRTAPWPVELYVQLPPDGPVVVSQLTVAGYPLRLDQGPKAVEQVALALDHFRRAFQNADERRSSPRYRHDGGVTLYPVDDELQVGPPVRCRARDVSRSGFSVAFVGDPPTGHVFVAFDGDGPTHGWAALARIVRAAPLNPGQHLLAGHFLFAGG